MVWPALIAAGAAIAGGMMNRRSQESAANKNADLQRQFAQQGIQWRVQDARKAGIHPLYAIGANTPTASPVHVGDSSMGNALASAGQDISRAMMASQDKKDQQRLMDLQLDEIMNRNSNALQTNQLLHQQAVGASLDNEMKKLQLLRLNRELSNSSGVPTSGGQATGSGLVKMQQSEQTMSEPGMLSRQATLNNAGKPAFTPYRIGGPKSGFALDIGNNDMSEWLEGQGLAGTLLGPLIWGAHYGSIGYDRARERFPQWMKDLRRYGTKP